MSTAGVERILERALQLARAGQPNPFTVLQMATEREGGDSPRDSSRAFLAVADVAGGSLARWYGLRGQPTEKTIQLLEEALFRAQMA